MRQAKTRCIGLAGALLALCVATPTSACQIPVFRYALERWEAAAHEIVIFHRGPLSPENQAGADALTAAGVGGKGVANLQPRLIDVNKPMPREIETLWKDQRNPQLPWMVVRYPDSQADTVSAFAGPFTPEAARLVLDSPARGQIAGRILKGESAVWVLIESGDKPADDAAQKLLTDELKKAQETLTLPDTTVQEGPRLLSKLPVRLAFSVLRISRTEPAEKMLVAQFLNSDKDASEAKGPLAFAVFGRGRAIGPFAGKDLSDKMIARAAEFLVGECSCQVKEQNPGFDLLISVEWASILSDAEAPAPTSAPATRPVSKDARP